MGILIEKEELLNAINVASFVVSTRDIADLFSSYLFKLEDGGLKLVATDLESSCIVSLESDIEGDFQSLALPSKRLGAIVRELPDGKVSITSNDELQVEIKSFESEISERYVITGLPSDDFPSIEIPKDLKWMDFDSSVLDDIITKTVFASAQGRESNQLMFNGVLFNGSNGVLDVVATDGKRLAWIQREIPMDKDVNVYAIVPAKVMAHVKKLLSGVVSCRVGFDARNAYFEIGNAVISVRLIEAKFPDYEAVIPKDVAIQVKLNREKVLTALRKVSHFADKDQFEKTFFSFRMRELVISSEDELGMAEVRVPINYSDEDFDIAFSNSYVSGVLKSVDYEEFFMGMNGNKDPVLFWFEEDKDYKYVLMPVRI